ncbi:MAG: YbaB/EbfC family nucleoid-associated protein [Rhodospirillaceae bacterium]|jgi:nucleoid-associated protein EbfC|nr:YbaB/EbfC family nucleoid-associated protein [Rhodospirillaceae bacterium]MBT4589103.1 YbaB/EbfC family nucleoid-associated protein [Rhodospirillaceae bacterium]MBT4940050.1 YbaB/EbfC family nucleoid-associated protein [Rhodospirillaceae bacterium]MBT5940806.1 YbaB/EbfC family nucleoid-associated protein [Rhodospirillaceae bacterium]MBT7267256.1 YbaB/EbfC family nucleoid-associated protein [Rhodospirillaceae bacterium]
MKNLGQMMKQAQEMQSKMTEMQDKLSEMEVTGSSGAGMIEVTLSGKSDVRKIKIDPSLIDPNDPEVLEDLIVAAFNDAKAKVEARVSDKMSEMTGGLQLPPGFKLPF